MPAFETFSLIFLLGLAWLWFDSVQVRAKAIREVMEVCAAEEVQLLDESVSISALTLDRDDDGRVRIRRAYVFDYSDTGNNRRRGSIVMLGDAVQIVNVGLRLAAVTTLH
jgi:hypothetical protein